MAYAPRRRGGIAKEVASFATAFTQGMKLFSDDDRRGGRSRDPYSDESISKGDDRLGSTGALGKFFGMGKDELSGLDRGIIANNKKLDLAISRGEVDKIKKYTSDAMDLQRLKGAEGGGSKPAGALPVKPKATATTAAAPAASAPAAAPAAVVDPAAAEASRRGDATSGAIGDMQSRYPELLQRQSFSPDGAPPEPTNAVLDAETDNAEISNAVLTDKDPDYTGSSIFDMGVDVARGGMIPALYAARGMSVPSRTGSTYGEEDFGFVPEGSDDQGSGATPGPENVPLPPADGPSVEDDERGDRTANLGLSRDPEELAVATIPAVKAGLNRIQDELKPSGAISAQDPAYQEKLQKFARGQGRMSDEEIREIDAVIDPDGTLPDASKSAARLAGIYKFYQDRGDPETASTVAARIILYNKFAAQTRGAMALQAINDGDLESGVRLLADAQNKDNPDGKTARGSVNPDGTINFELGWDKLTGFERTEGGRATKEDMVKLAQATASGVRTMSDLSVMENALKGKTKGAPPTAAATNRAAAATSAEKFTTALGEVTTAAKGVAAARASGDPDAIKAADDALEAARTKALSGASSDNVIAQRRSAIKAAIAQAIPSAVPAPRAPTSIEERKAAAAEAEKGAILKDRAVLEYYDRAGRGVNAFDIYEQEPGPIEGVRTKLKSALADVGYRGATDAPGSDEASEERAKRFMMELEGKPGKDGKLTGGVLTDVSINASGQKDPAEARSLTQPERDAYTDIFARLATKNNEVTPRTLASVVYNITNPRIDEGGKERRIDVDPKTGKVSYNGKTFYTDQQSFVEMMQMRGKALKDMRATEGLSAAKARDKKIEARTQTIGKAADREQAETGARMLRFADKDAQKIFEKGLQQATPQNMPLVQPPPLRGSR